MLASRKGRERRYFRRSSTAVTILDDKSSTLPSSKGSVDDLEEIHMDVSTVDHESEDSKLSLEPECLSAGSVAPNISDDEKELEEADLFDSDETIGVSSNKVAVQVQPILQECWSQLKWTSNLTREELVTHVFELLFYLLIRCFPESNENSQIVWNRCRRISWVSFNVYPCSTEMGIDFTTGAMLVMLSWVYHT